MMNKCLLLSCQNLYGQFRNYKIFTKLCLTFSELKNVLGLVLGDKDPEQKLQFPNFLKDYLTISKYDRKLPYIKKGSKHLEWG